LVQATRRPHASTHVARTACVTPGKTHLAARLAAAYGLVHVNAAALVAELPHMDADTQKVRWRLVCGAGWQGTQGPLHWPRCMAPWIVRAACMHAGCCAGAVGAGRAAAARPHGARGTAPAGATPHSRQAGVGAGRLAAQRGRRSGADRPAAAAASSWRRQQQWWCGARAGWSARARCGWRHDACTTAAGQRRQPGRAGWWCCQGKRVLSACRWCACHCRVVCSSG
jgi:hypothetical protein